jgi:hypothetical protein
VAVLTGSNVVEIMKEVTKIKKNPVDLDDAKIRIDGVQ